MSSTSKWLAREPFNSHQVMLAYKFIHSGITILLETFERLIFGKFAWRQTLKHLKKRKQQTVLLLHHTWDNISHKLVRLEDGISYKELLYFLAHTEIEMLSILLTVILSGDNKGLVLTLTSYFYLTVFSITIATGLSNFCIGIIFSCLFP